MFFSVLIAFWSTSFSFHTLLPLGFVTPSTPERPEILSEGLFDTLLLAGSLFPVLRTMVVAKTMVWTARSYLRFLKILVIAS